MTSNLKHAQRLAAGLHLTIFILSLFLVIHNKNNRLSQAPFFLFFWPDLPVTILFFAPLVVLSEESVFAIDEIFSNLFPSYPFNNYWNFWHVIIFYGILGTIQWYFVPKFIAWLKARFHMVKH